MKPLWSWIVDQIMQTHLGSRVSNPEFQRLGEPAVGQGMSMVPYNRPVETMTGLKAPVHIRGGLPHNH